MAAVSAAAASAAVFLLATIAGTSTPPSFYRSTEAIHTLLKRAEAEHPGRLRVETHRLRQTRDLFDYVDVACIAARQQPARLKALVVCGEHGRELITAEIGLHLIGHEHLRPPVARVCLTCRMEQRTPCRTPCRALTYV